MACWGQFVLACSSLQQALAFSFFVSSVLFVAVTVAYLLPLSLSAVLVAGVGIAFI